MAVPVGTILRKTDAQAAREVAAAAAERDATHLVVGHPVHSDGAAGPIARRARNFAERLATASGLPVSLQAEGLSTAAADAALREAGFDAGSRRAGRDAEAAAVILRDFLSRNRAC